MGTRTIAIANQKGGVGKTTTTLCLADSLRRLGRRTLVVDLDQQANATRTYGVRTDGVATTYDILTGRVRDASGAVVSTPSGDIVPGDIAMAGVEVEMAGMTCRETVLADAMAGLVAGGAYDYVLVDCSPSLGVVTTNALVLAQEVVVPVLVDGYSLDGLGKLKAEDMVNPLITLLRDPSAQVRVHAAQALGSIGDPHSKAHIVHAAQAEKDEAVKAEMVRAEAMLREY